MNQKPSAVEPLQIWRHRFHGAAKAVVDVRPHRTYKGTHLTAVFGAYKYARVAKMLSRPDWVFEGYATEPTKDAAPMQQPIAGAPELQRRMRP